jgi:hypothetical protein
VIEHSTVQHAHAVSKSLNKGSWPTDLFSPCQKIAYISRSVGEVVKVEFLHVVSDEIGGSLWLMLQLEDVFHDDLQIFKSRYKSTSDDGLADDGCDKVADSEIVPANLLSVLAKWRHFETIVSTVFANAFFCMVSAL